MSDPLVLLALADDPVASAVEEVLRRRRPPLRLAYVESSDELIERAAEESAVLAVCSQRLENGSFDTLRRLSQRAPQTRGIMLFDDAGDPRRALASAAGAYDYVVPPERDLSGLLIIVERVFARSDLEGRLEATQGQVRALVEGSNDGIYILKSGRFQYVNPRFEQMVGFGASELLAEGFPLERIIAPKSRPVLRDRQRRIQQGLPIEPRYEFEALRKDESTFDALVSVSYIEVDGEPATLGIMQDITERKRFEIELVRKNRELALLNEIASSVNSAVDLDETLRVACLRLNELLGFSASGITLLTRDRSALQLRISEGLPETIVSLIEHVAVDTDTLLARAVRTGEVHVVSDLANDERLSFDLVRQSSYGGCIVIPLEARSRILGVAFFFTPEGKRPEGDITDFMRAIGSLIGTAVEKAALLEQERAAVRRLRAVDDIALAIASSLDVESVADAVARNLRRVFDAERVLIARYVPSEDIFVPLAADEENASSGRRPFSRDESLMGLALDEELPIQRLRPDSPYFPESWDRERPLPRYDEELFAQGFGCTVALRVVSGGSIVGAMHIARRDPRPVDKEDLEALASLSLHVAIAVKNADLFSSRNRALTDLKLAQDKLVQSEKLNALGELAAGVAHDFNNVLGAILGRAQLLKTRLDDADLKKHAIIIEKAATDGAETVRRIQEIGRQESTDDFVDVDVHEILQDVAELTVPRWRERTREQGRPVTLEVLRWPHGDPLVRGNPHELREVLINLVHNGVDAMPEGGRITLSAAITGGEGGELCEIRVKDSGTGIPAHVKARIFDPFFTTKGEQGTGLGLSVSYSIIQRHGGDLEVESRHEGDDHGTTFIIALPRLRVEERAREEPPVETHELSEGRARVLVIDDEENIRDILTDILETGDHEVVTAVDGPTGLERLEEGRFDLVFTDLGLPGMNGYEVAAEVKARFPDVPVGLVTGWGATLDPEKARRYGVDLVLSKPFRFDQVLKLVDDALSHKVSRQGAAATSEDLERA